jgi:hypothetical protein
MYVHVNETRHESTIAEIDRFRTRGMSDTRAHFDDPVTAHEYLAGCNDFPRFDIENPGRVEHGQMRRRLRENNGTAK